MSLLDSLKFVKGGVARKDLAPILNHFRIAQGVITGFNGNISLSAPIALSLDCQPKAAPFTKAIEICESMDAVPTLSMTKGGKLTVAAGSFKVHIDCIDESFPSLEPEGEIIDIQPGMMEAFKVLAPLIGEDASRPWARGILIRNGSAYATNNVVIGQYWVNCVLPFDINIPEECIRELLRLSKGALPVRIHAIARSITFEWEGGQYLKSQLLTVEWPNLGPVLDRGSLPRPLAPDFFGVLDKLAPYTDKAKRVFFQGNTLSTHMGDGEGASFTLDESAGMEDAKGAYNLELLRSLDGIVASVDWSLYPSAALFFGPNTTEGYPLFRGAIAVMKLGAI